MRFFIYLIIVATSLLQAAARAQSGDALRYASYPAAVGPDCGLPAPPPHQPCSCPQCCQEIHVRIPEDKLRESRRGESGAGAHAANPGVYVSPPRSGRVEEAGSAFGIRGMSLTLPKIRLELPTIELPSIVRYGHTQRMRLDAANAPFMSMPAQAAGLQVPGRTGEAGTPNRDRRHPETGQGHDEALQKSLKEIQAMKESLKAKHALLEKQYSQVQNLLHQLQCQQRLPNQPVPPAQPPACLPNPRGPVPHPPMPPRRNSRHTEEMPAPSSLPRDPRASGMPSVPKAWEATSHELASSRPAEAAGRYRVNRLPAVDQPSEFQAELSQRQGWLNQARREVATLVDRAPR